MQKAYQSETSKHRAKLASFCTGYGIDIGFGGDPITPNAIRVDLEIPYANTGEFGVQLGGDSRSLYWFKDAVLDFVYSSHVLEDFDVSETEPVMREWTRALKEGGRLVLLLPDQQRFVEHCRRTGQPSNPCHAIDHFSLKYVKEVAERIGNLDVLSAEDGIDEYSFYAVFVKKSATRAPQDEVKVLAKEVIRLRQERADMHQQLRQASKKLDRYRKNPVVRIMKAIYFFPRKLIRR